MENSSEQAPLENESENLEVEESTLESTPEENIDGAEATMAPSPPAKQASAGPNPLTIGFALVLAFAIGLALGFFGRPRIIEDVPVQVVVTVVPDNSAQAVASNNNPGTSDNTEAVGENEDSAAAANTGDTEAPVDPNAPPTPTIMDFLMSDARHIQGDEAAPVTIIEFSDFK